MTDLRIAAQQALEALTAHADLLGTMYLRMDAITALRAALAQQAEPVEPVATITECEACFTPDVCQLRGTCDHYAASQLRIAAQPKPGAEPVQEQGEPEQKPVAHSVIAGALFDFMGWLTSRKKRIVLSSADNASPAVEAITEFAKMRDLSLDDAKVQEWQEHLAAPPKLVPLTDEEIMDAFHAARNAKLGASQDNSKHRLSVVEIARAVERKLEEKNRGR